MFIHKTMVIRVLLLTPLNSTTSNDIVMTVMITKIS